MDVISQRIAGPLAKDGRRAAQRHRLLAEMYIGTPCAGYTLDRVKHLAPETFKHQLTD